MHCFNPTRAVRRLDRVNPWFLALAIPSIDGTRTAWKKFGIVYRPNFKSSRLISLCTARPRAITLFFSCVLLKVNSCLRLILFQPADAVSVSTLFWSSCFHWLSKQCQGRQCPRWLLDSDQPTFCSFYSHPLPVLRSATKQLLPRSKELYHYSRECAWVTSLEVACLGYLGLQNRSTQGWTCLGLAQFNLLEPPMFPTAHLSIASIVCTLFIYLSAETLFLIRSCTNSDWQVNNTQKRPVCKRDLPAPREVVLVCLMSFLLPELWSLHGWQGSLTSFSTFTSLVPTSLGSPLSRCLFWGPFDDPHGVWVWCFACADTQLFLFDG